MSDAVAVHWLAEGEPAAADTLRAWARAHGVELVLEDEPLPALPVDPSVAERVERELERARDATGSMDADAADRALGRADALLREHPELPQAAWLSAEVARAWATRLARVEPRDDARARAAWARAAALDGGRVAGVGEAASPPAARARTTLVVRGPARQIVRVDGAVIAPTGPGAYPVDASPAEHAVTVSVDDRVTYAAWLALGAEPELQLRAAESPACNQDRLAAARRTDAGVEAVGITCPRWIAVAPARASQAIAVARCERDQCGPLLEWRTGPVVTGPPARGPEPRRWPTWATVALVGAGVVAATTVSLFAAGVFSDREVETRFVVGGARQE